ncbi:MAG: type II secretion system protein M, partial [Burkholderiaceae bacterium]|nr:type II secretion system protein M [Burkholderiaceae bacterium]
MTLSSMTSAVRARWQDLRPREKSLVTTAMTLVLLALVWWVGISPALKVLRQAGAQQRSLDAQWQQMQGLAAEAGALQSRPRIKYDDAVAAL